MAFNEISSPPKNNPPNKDKENNVWNKEIKIGFLSSGLTDKKRKDLYYEINTLLIAGVDLKRTLEVLHEETRNKKIKKIIHQILSSVIEGQSLSQALKKTNDFSLFEINSVSIGEETGRLSLVLTQLGSYYEKRMKLKRKMVSIFTYPAFTLLVTFGVLYFMLGTVVPMFIDIFKQFNAELPSLTQTVIRMSEWMPIVIYSLIGIIITLLIIHYCQKEKNNYRNFTANLMMKTPIFGPLIKKVYLARFCQSMQLLTSAKVPIVRALNLSKEMVQFYPIEKACDEMIEGVKQGYNLHEIMKKNSTIFYSKMIFLIQVGEEVNALDDIFDKLSTQYDEEIDHNSSLIGTILEPMMIIIIGVIVALILVAMYIPLFNLSNVISG